MNIGIRAHDIGKLPMDELSEKISEKGFNCIQLAPVKALEGFEYYPGCFDLGRATNIKSSFSKKGISISVLGCYINPVHPDKEERGKLLDRFKEHLRYVRDFGCSIVATETGSLNADLSFNSDNHGDMAFNIIAESIGELVREAEKAGVNVGVEGVWKHTINTPERLKRLIDEVNSDNLKVVFDPVNYLNINNYNEQDKIINQCFELFGDKIKILHAKDFILQDGKVMVAPAGKGMLNYDLVFKLLKSTQQPVDILLEDIKEPFMVESRKFIENNWLR